MNHSDMTLTTILYFGIARDCAGVAEESMDFNGISTVDDLWRKLTLLHPRLEQCQGIARVAIDMEYVVDTETIPATAREIAIIPPVAGG